MSVSFIYLTPNSLLVNRRLQSWLIASISLICIIPAVQSQPRAENSALLPLPEIFFPNLKTLLDTAAAQSPRMITRNADDAAAEANRIVARSGQLPSLGGGLSYYPWQRDVRVDVPTPLTSNRLTYNFGMTQPLYHWGALKNNTRIGELQLKITQGQTAEAYRMLVQEIRAHFLQLVIRKTALVRACFSQDLAEQQLKLAEEKLKLKVISESDIFGVRMNLTQANLSVDRAQEDYDSARRTLAKLSGSPVLSDDQVPDAIPPVAVSLNTLETQMAGINGANPPDTNNLRALEQQIQIEQLNYKNASVRLNPKFNFVVGLSQDQQSYTSNIGAKYGVKSYYYGTSVSWSIFDGLATRGLKSGSLARRRQLEQSYRTMSADLIEQAQSQLKQLGFAARGMAISDQYLFLGENGVRVRKDDMGRGLASQADVEAAQMALFDARINAYNARLDFLLRTTEYLSTLAKDPAVAKFSAPHP